MKLTINTYLAKIKKYPHIASFGVAILLTVLLIIFAYIYAQSQFERGQLFSHLTKPSFSSSFSVETVAGQSDSFTPLYRYSSPEPEAGYAFAQSAADSYNLTPSEENTGVWKEWSNKGAYLRYEAISGTIRYYHPEFIYAENGRLSSAEEWKTIARKHLSENYHYNSNQSETITLYSIIGKDGNEPIWNGTDDPNNADIIVYSLPVAPENTPVLLDNAISQTVELIMSADGTIQNVSFPWATIHAEKGRSIAIKNRAEALTLLEKHTDPYAVYITDPQIGVTKQFTTLTLSNFFLQKITTAYALSQKDGKTSLTPVYVYSGEVSYENDPSVKTYPCSIYIAL